MWSVCDSVGGGGPGARCVAAARRAKPGVSAAFSAVSAREAAGPQRETALVPSPTHPHPLQVVVSSCGHDGPMGAHSVKRLSKLGMVPDVPGMAALDMNSVSVWTGGAGVGWCCS